MVLVARFVFRELAVGHLMSLLLSIETHWSATALVDNGLKPHRIKTVKPGGWYRRRLFGRTHS